jgi:hypothetical protein
MFELNLNFLNGAEMSEGNIEDFLNKRIQGSLQTGTSDEFSDEVMKRIKLSLEFAKEDKKTFKFAGMISIAVIAVMSVLLYFIGSSIVISSGEEESSGFVFLRNIYTYLSDFATEILSAVGISGTGDSLLYLIIVTFIVLLFIAADKLILGKRN